MVTSWRFKSSHPHQLFNKPEKILNQIERESVNKARFFFVFHLVEPTKNPFAATKSCHGTSGRGVFVLEPKS